MGNPMGYFSLIGLTFRWCQMCNNPELTIGSQWKLREPFSTQSAKFIYTVTEIGSKVVCFKREMGQVHAAPLRLFWRKMEMVERAYETVGKEEI